MYTIGQISKMFNLPISTLRYYDKEGLLKNAEICLKQERTPLRSFS